MFQAKKEDAEKKRLEALAKKKEREDMLQAESADIASKQTKANPIKVTRAQIAELNEKRENIALGKKQPELETHLTGDFYIYWTIQNILSSVLYLDDSTS